MRRQWTRIIGELKKNRRNMKTFSALTLLNSHDEFGRCNFIIIAPIFMCEAWVNYISQPQQEQRNKKQMEGNTKYIAAHCTIALCYCIHAIRCDTFSLLSFTPSPSPRARSERVNYSEKKRTKVSKFAMQSAHCILRITRKKYSANSIGSEAKAPNDWNIFIFLCGLNEFAIVSKANSWYSLGSF